MGNLAAHTSFNKHCQTLAKDIHVLTQKPALIQTVQILDIQTEKSPQPGTVAEKLKATPMNKLSQCNIVKSLFV